MKPSIRSEYPINDLLRRRWSGRAYSNKTIQKDQIMQLIEAARWAPSCYNEQPWRFIVSQKGTKAFDEMLELLAPGNQEWAKEANLLIITVANTEFKLSGKPNRHALHDLGLAVMSLTIQATEMDLNVHQMGGFNREAAEEKYGLSENEEAVTAIAIGYHGDPDDLSEVLKERELSEQKRKALTDIATILN